MTEYQIRRKAKKFFEEQGFKIWFAPRVKWQQSDIFSIWDGVAWKGKRFIFFQLTTFENRKARLKKIQEYLEKNEVDLDGRIVRGWVLGWHSKKKEFDVIKV